MNDGIRKIALIMVFSFVFLSLGLVYWQVVKADEMLDNPANRRAIYLEERITRGGIFDRNGVVLAKTEHTADGKVRTYPQGEMFEPLLGYATVKYGSAGIEATEAETLLGMKNPSILRRIQNAFELQRTGNDLILTLDSRLQETAYQSLQGKTGAVVAIDPQNGDVLALVSQPSYDAGAIEQDWDKIIAEKDSPLVNHAFSLFPPGSIMKVVTSAAIFQAGLGTTELYDCEGSTVINGQTIQEQNDKAHGWVNYDLALAYSCNTYFAQYGIKAGVNHFLEAVSNFGFGRDIPFDQYVPISSITRDDPLPENLSLNLFAESTFGQGQVMVSPFHMALITAGVANDGKIMVPHLIDSVLDSKQNSIYQRTPEVWLTPLSKEEAEKITSGMVLAVNKGTASPGAISGAQIAAKTGSAEPGGDGDTHAWYIAFAPAENPEIAVAVLVEHGGTGGGAAAPIAKAVIEKALELKEGEN
ncbi:MAG: penicillin-binding protein 2 [Dehalobacter sp. 4CP]|uniref:peptidoglycan D,D-transpeptidase FtsI family protein n=1 Tax=Dehalobacter sp. CP TaxID=2594474 RepID=UPI0013CC0F92|nr:penicillin-binding protein 2 [Dehalobacter sp. 4CP]